MTHDILTPDIAHRHFIGRYEVTKPIKKGGEAFLANWMDLLIKGLDMKIMSGPHVVYSDAKGNRGITAVAIIETSHVAIHIWDEPFPALVQIDFYTCGNMDPEYVDACLAFMGVLKASWRVVNRENGIECIDGGEYGHDNIISRASGSENTPKSASTGG